MSDYKRLDSDRPSASQEARVSDKAFTGVDRRHFLRLMGTIGTASAFTGTLAACGGPASTTGPSAGGAKDTIEAGLSYGLSGGFDPLTASGAAPVAANMHIFEGMVDLDPVTREPYAALATGLPQKIDETTYRMTLRPGATFHDGSPVTVDDVVFSFNRVLDPANDSLMLPFVPFLAGVEAIDPQTVEFTLHHPFALLDSRISVVKIVPKKIVEADEDAFDATPVGSGPFQLVSATKDDKIVFRRWESYNGPQPAKVTNMIWRLLADSAARISALESGRVLAIEDVPVIDVKRARARSQVESVQSFGQLFLMFNCSKHPFSDKRVRQALHYAIDKDKVIATAMVGNGTAATSYLQESHPDYRKASTVYGHNRKKAKRLLSEAGVSNLSLTLTTTDTGWVADIAPLIKESWDAIGVRTELDIAKSSGQYKKVEAGAFQVMAAPGDPSVFGADPDLLMSWYYTSNTWAQKRFRWAGTPPHRQVLDLMERAAQNPDPKARTELWSQAVDIVADEAPLYPIVHRKLPTAWNSESLAHFRPMATTGLSFLGVGRT